MSLVRVTGLPNEATSNKQLRNLRLYLRRAGVEQLWINEIADTRGTDFKEAGIEVPSEEEAYMVKNFISKVPYRKNGLPVFLRSEVVGYDRGHYRRSRDRSPRSHYSGGYRSRERSYGRYSPRHSLERGGSRRSRSPLYEDTSKLDIEIELLRKKRQLIEEERRLLTETKKLEMMKEFGASSSDYEYRRRSRDREMRPNRFERKRDYDPPHVPAPKGLPQFVMPCKMLIKQYRPVISELVIGQYAAQEKQMLMTMLRAHLRRTLALDLEGRDYMPTSAIIDLYRQLHPKEGDEALIKKMIGDIRSSFWPLNDIPEKPEKAPKKATTEIKKKNFKKKTQGTPTATNVKQEPADKTVVQEKPEESSKPVNIKKEIDVEPNPGDDKSSDVVDAAKNIETAKNATNADSKESTNVSSKGIPAEVAVQVEPNKVVGQIEPTKVVDEVVSTDVVNDETTGLDKLADTEDHPSETNDVTKIDVEPSAAEPADMAENIDMSRVVTADTYEPEDADEDDWATNGVDWDVDDVEGRD